MPGGPGAQNGKKGAQSDPNYVSRLLDCVPVFHKIITPPTYYTVRSECLPGGAKNYSCATDGVLEVHENDVG